MCIVLALIAAMVSGSVIAGICLILGQPNVPTARPIFPADQRDPLLPIDRNGNSNAF